MSRGGSKPMDMTGLRFGRLVAIKQVNIPGKNGIFWLWKCDCGNEKAIRAGCVRSGNTVSCGCYIKELMSKMRKTHDFKSHLSEYKAWRSMKERCLNPNHKWFKRYGGRGISVCDRWLASFENFLEDMGLKPSKKHTLDRFPDNNGNYEPLNCRWATWEEQQKNRGNNVWIEYNGQKMVVEDFKKMFNCGKSNIYWHLERRTPQEVIDFFNNKNQIK